MFADSSLDTRIAESAAWAAVQAINNNQTPADIDIQTLQRTLAEHKSMLTFLNDIALDDDYPHNAAVQWAGTTKAGLSSLSAATVGSMIGSNKAPVR